jgi:hypothetical protein
VIVAHGTPERDAQGFSLDIDMEVHVGGRRPYRAHNSYTVPAGVTVRTGVTLPIRVDADDPSRIAIDWATAQRAQAGGGIRPV